MTFNKTHQTGIWHELFGSANSFISQIPNACVPGRLATGYTGATALAKTLLLMNALGCAPPLLSLSTPVKAPTSEGPFSLITCSQLSYFLQNVLSILQTILSCLFQNSIPRRLSPLPLHPHRLAGSSPVTGKAMVSRSDDVGLVRSRSIREVCRESSRFWKMRGSFSAFKFDCPLSKRKIDSQARGQ